MARNLSTETESKINDIISEQTIQSKNMNNIEDKKDNNIEIKDNEENKNEDIGEIETHQNIQNTDAQSKSEHEARLRGWRPLDEYDGDKSKWRSADEFLEVGKIYDQNKSVKLERELSSMQQQMDQILEINKKQAEKLAREKAEYLEIARLQAIQESNVDQVNKIDTQLYDVKQEINTYKEQPKVDVRYKLFIEKNKDWLNSDTIDNMQLARLANDYEQQLINNRPELTIDQRLELTEKAIKSSDLYLSKHVNRNRDRPTNITLNSPENSNLKKGNKKYLFKDLPNEMQRTVNNIYNRMKNMGISKDEYAQQLFESGVITNE
jgi:hypothetical protein